MENVKSQKVAVFTYIPSPYQVELFNAVAKENIFSISTCYIYSRLNPRIKGHSSVAGLWEDPAMLHDHIILDDKRNKYAEAKTRMAASDLAVFGYYRHPAIMKLMEERAREGRKWCFWGERPGYKGKGLLGLYYRKWKLRVLFREKAPIWCIGKWAEKEYRAQFGGRRAYFNMPYFSDLSHFNQIDYEKRDKTKRTFLFSGSLIYRKGVDLLAGAFKRLTREFQNVELKIMGEGMMRKTLERKLANLHKKVHFLGFRQWKELDKVYRDAHVLCLPSRYDGWAVAVPEALASGMPVISTDRTGAALEFIKNGENGWIIPAGNEKALYEAMKRVANLTGGELLRCAACARQSVERHSLADGVRRFQESVLGSL